MLNEPTTWAIADGLEGIPVGAITNGIGVVTVLFIIFWLLTIGRLHTDREFKRMEADHLREVERMQVDHIREMQDLSHDRDEWRASQRIGEQARLEERENTRSLIGGFATVNSFLEGFRKAVEHTREGEPS